jgi:hypothetical protein
MEEKTSDHTYSGMREKFGRKVAFKKTTEERIVKRKGSKQEGKKQ